MSSASTLQVGVLRWRSLGRLGPANAPVRSLATRRRPSGVRRGCAGERLDEDGGRLVVKVDVVDVLKVAWHAQLQLLVEPHQGVVRGAGNRVLRHAECTSNQPISSNHVGPITDLCKRTTTIMLLSMILTSLSPVAR